MMRGFMTLVALAGFLLVGNSLLDNTAAPIQAEAPSLPTPIVESSPSDKCCGDDCDCCDMCPCNSVLSVAVEPVVEVVAEVPEPQPQQKPAVYAIGADIRTASGAIETVTKVESINGNWAYFTQPKSVSVSVSNPVIDHYDYPVMQPQSVIRVQQQDCSTGVCRSIFRR